jgi:hypothetical protein
LEENKQDIYFSDTMSRQYAIELIKLLLPYALEFDNIPLVQKIPKEDISRFGEDLWRSLSPEMQMTLTKFDPFRIPTLSYHDEL